MEEGAFVKRKITFKVPASIRKIYTENDREGGDYNVKGDIIIIENTIGKYLC